MLCTYTAHTCPWLNQTQRIHSDYPFPLSSHPFSNQSSHRRDISISSSTTKEVDSSKKSQFSSDRILLAFNHHSKGNMVLSSTKRHLILLVLFNVLLFQCEYVNARPNATSGLEKTGGVSAFTIAYWSNKLNSKYPHSAASARVTQFGFTTLARCINETACLANPRIARRSHTQPRSCCSERACWRRSSCRREVSGNNSRFLTCRNAIHYRHLDSVC